MKKYFITGLVTLLPLAVTIWIAHFAVDLLTKPFIGVLTLFTDRIPIASDQFIRMVSQIIILVILFFFTLFLGFVWRQFFFYQLLRTADQFLIRIPLVNKVYKTSKEIVKSFFSVKTGSFKQVVMISFPYEGCYCLGLIARDAPKTCSTAENDELVSVFVPTTPNPTTGFLVMSHKSKLIYLEMKADDAVKYIVSCGVVQPETKRGV